MSNYSVPYNTHRMPMSQIEKYLLHNAMGQILLWSKALTNAWKDACGSTTPSKVVVPKATYMLKQIDLKGPCKSPIKVQVDGKILAPKNPKHLNGVDQWVNFGYINFFTLSGEELLMAKGSAQTS
ncbi:unnamed protein product [Lupinus luteus]|uniref:Uncharacterized protein n=1 Tax=Lupinus luteus TaxID=3873 RepID=A0AAV1XN40_LUPLU